MTEQAMLKLLEEEYLSKILGFCYQKVNSQEDAEDLTQNITMEVLKSIRAGKSIENLNAFIWSVSNHTFFKWLRAKKHENTAYLTELFAAADNIEEEYLRREQEIFLHREIAWLSENYRKAVVLYYFDEKSCEETAQILGKSTGTVKWWLHDARKAIKEGMNTVREFGEKSFRPGKLFVSCQGTLGLNDEPVSCAKRKSAQNILLTAYKVPITIEGLCSELGISAPYIEDEVGYLVDNQLMKEAAAGKYQTDFVILPGQNAEIADKIYEACFPAYYNALFLFLNKKRDLLQSDGFNLAEFAWERLLWVYLHIINDIMLCRFKYEECKKVCSDIPDRPNGGKWVALGYENGVFTDHQPEWKEYQPFDGPVHKMGREFAQGFFHYWSGLDSNVFFTIPDGVFALCREVIKGNVTPENFTEEQKYLFSKAVEMKLFIKSGKSFKQNYFFVGRGGREIIEKLAEEFYNTAFPYFKQAYTIILDTYKSGIPKHLRWQMGNFLSNYLGTFVTGSLYEGVKTGSLSVPDENNKEWLSLFASEA